MKKDYKHNFSENPEVHVRRSTFDRSSNYKTTFDSGYLIPFFVDEALPGDTFNLKTNYLARLNTPIVPFMDNLHFDTFFFAVPMRLVWDNFEKFMGEQKNPGDSIDYLIPSVTCPADVGFWVGSIADYFGLPTGIKGLENISSLPFRAYNLIYNEWFRDQNLVDSVPVPMGDGPDDFSNFKLLKRAKKHDYFTSALPWPQKGEDVTIGLAESAPIVSDGNFALSYINTSGDRYDAAVVADTASGTVHGAGILLENVTNVTDSYTQYSRGMKADLSDVSGITINQMREAILMQRFLESAARSGSRYTEIIRGMFGVKSPDARLQRPEYLGGSTGLVNIAQVPQTSATDGTTPQGNMSAYGYYLDQNKHGFVKSFTEHTIIIGLCCVRADLSYQQGINRMWLRRSRYDFYWPTFAHLGEQEIYNAEIYAQGTDADSEVFGYQERYAEYRYKPSLITGKLRSTYAQSLDYWHLAQKFENLPTLSKEFIEENPPVDRVIAVQDEPQFTLEAQFDLNCVRPMPVRSIPGLVDHF